MVTAEQNKINAARPLVYVTALLPVTVILTLNLTAVLLRNRLQSRFRSV